MPEQYYQDALKLAQKEYKACIAADTDPYLPVLENLIATDALTGTNLGLVQIPTEFIVGTKTQGRMDAFARNYMPLLDQDSEFAYKWRNLCQSHLNEGIRDPIKAYEYLNRYYVEEGNKRVSVLKFFDAVNIPANVTRILPERTPENEVYFEYLDFYKNTKINFIEFSKKGSYISLLHLIGKPLDESWTKEEISRFSSAFYFFKSAYEEKGGNDLSVKVGDAFLAYLRVYGYQSLLHSSYSELKKAILGVWEELKLQKETSPIELVLDPAAEKKPGLISKVLPPSHKTLNVAFLHDKNSETSGWTYGHELGRNHVEHIFDGQIHTTAYPDAMQIDPHSVIEQAIADGNSVLFTTSPRLLPASLRAAVDHPEVTIFNCSLNKSHRYIRTYYARMYEVKFIIGAIAGALTGKDQIGYVCDYPIYGQIAGINAFALGAQMVNPRAKVYLEWSSISGSKAAIQKLNDRGIHLISSQDIACLGQGSRSSFGLARIADNSQILLASPRWKWGTYYEEILRRILDKSIQAEYDRHSKALNYYWGMSAGVVDLYYGNALPVSVQKLANHLKESICRGQCNPFIAPITAQDGRIHEHDLTSEQIINMDYLVDNVVGSIPVYDELNPIGKATVDLVGIESSTQHSSDPLS